MNEPTHLDLFSGIGGFALAAQWAGFRTIGFCEIDKYCQKVLAKNFRVVPDSIYNGSCGAHADATKQSGNRTQDGILERSDAPRLSSNIFDLNGRNFSGVSLITGGFPCQPFSVAGKRRGAADDRAIWPEMFRVISEARPAWVLGENVPGIIPMELDNVLSDLEGIGYTTRAFVIPACAVDARHRRDRLWIVGRSMEYANEKREQRLPIGKKQKNPSTRIPCSNAMADAGSISGHGWTSGPCRWEREPLETLRDAGRGGWQEDGLSIPESLLGRVAHGIPSRVDRLKGLGNAIVSQVAYEILREIRQCC